MSADWKFDDAPDTACFTATFVLQGSSILRVEYRDDISPPSEEACEGLDVGDVVKLIFRFADENAGREDGQCERMWVEITGFDEDGYFVGTIESDPHHTAAKYGDVVSFHPLPIAEIYADEE